MDVAGFRELKLAVEKSGENWALEVKAVFPKAPESILAGLPGLSDLVTEEGYPELEATPGGLPKYKPLKKRMKSVFKGVAAALAAGALPIQADLDLFVADSRLMCQYPGKGDEFYPAYLEAVDRLIALVEEAKSQTPGTEDYAQAVTQALLAANALNQLKKDCHSRHA